MTRIMQRKSCGNLLFMGNGERSIADCYILVGNLMKAFELMSGTQQNLPCTTQLTEEQYKEFHKETLRMETEIYDIAEDIFIALTGKVPNV